VPNGPVFLIHFPKAQYWVNVQTLKAYVSWSWHTSQRKEKHDFRRFLRQLWCPTLAFNIPELLARAFGTALELGVTPGWTRYPTDGTRLQIFDAKGRGVCKVLLPNVRSSSLAAELAVRQEVGNFAPAVIAINHKANAYVEEWIVASQPLYSLDKLDRVLRHLQGTLYDVEWIDLDQFLGKLTRWGPISDEILQVVHCAFAKLGNEGRVPWSMVHGDLVEQNLLLNQANELILIDWEYTRECIATYDRWLYQYNHERVVAGCEMDVPVLCKGLDACLRGLPGIDVEDLDPRSLHLLHLVERMHYLAHISPHTTDIVRQTMLTDMRHAFRKLATS
jgi:hypothetical protein